MVNKAIKTVLMRLKISNASQNASNASTTVSPKIVPPNANAYAGKTSKRLASSATPVAIRQAAQREKITVFKFLRY